MSLKTKNINYIKAYKQNNKRTIFNNFFWMVTSLIIFIFILGAIYFFIGFRTTVLDNQLKELNEYVNNSNNKELYEQATYNENEVITALYLYKNNLLSIEKIIKSTPIFSKNDFESFYNCIGNEITISNLEFENNSIFSFEAIAISVIAIPDYIERLKATEIFSNIEYYGYEYSNSNFRFSLKCTLKAVNIND